MLALILIVLTVLLLCKSHTRLHGNRTVWYTEPVGVGQALSYNRWKETTTVLVNNRRYDVVGEIESGKTVRIERAVYYLSPTKYLAVEVLDK